MKLNHQKISLIKLLRQRNAMGLFAGVVAVSNLILCAFLFFQSEKIIVIPPETKERIWFKGSSVSAVYLEEMAIFFSHLLLDKSEQNSRFHHVMLLKYVHPSSHSQVLSTLLADEARYKKEGLSTSFYPKDVEVNVHAKTVVLKGELLTRVGERHVSTVKRNFLVKFANQHSRWWLSEFSLQPPEEG